MKSWKTTLLGAILSAGLWMQSNTSGTLQHVGSIIATVAALGAGLVQKDSDVTGGTKPQ